ncbi:hypothetical protein MMC09_001008 [Bachmanniomyces sp. S44760]|nr:hypothetical protein [Bachmanniomyces sp. S44760]
MPSVFAVPIFFICLRETLETSIIVSILLTFLKQTLGPDRDAVTYKKLVRQVWWGTCLGLALCIIIGAGLIGAFYALGKNHWASTENIWEGTFAIIASVVISLMGAALLRVSKLQDKWRLKLAKALEAKDSARRGTAGGRFKVWCEKYSMFILPFITVLREGLEAVVFIGGVSLGFPATTFPIPVFCGLLLGCLIGVAIYKGGNFASIQTFLIISTSVLYLVAAGLFSKAVWLFEEQKVRLSELSTISMLNVFKWNQQIGGDADETGDGPGSYNINHSVWHVNCCSPELNGGGGWGIFNALLGWQNSATYGSVISYNLYWIVVVAGFLTLRYIEKNEKSSAGATTTAEATSNSDNAIGEKQQIEDMAADVTSISS